ncbi:glycosyltransferase [Agrococcus terreus]|uniref:glycosyltransferase n=1 Tax=Agrococcus terreus TaxID=574649 RepID=UPI00384D89E7
MSVVGPAGPDSPLVVVALSHEHDVAAWRARHERGEVLDATPYGYERAGDRFRMAWTEPGAEGRLVARARRALAARLGFDVVHAWRNRALLRSADVIWTHTEREHLAVAALLGRGGPPVLAQSVWLWDAWPSMPPWRRRLVAALLRRHRVEAVHSAENLAASRAAVPGRRVELVPFGSTALPRVAHRPAAVEPPVVLAVGNDIDRDWPLLARAAAEVPEARFLVISGSRAARRAEWPGNVDRRARTSRAELVAAFSAASCAVVPLRPNLHASGTTSCIEALGAGRPLVVSRAGGIEAYVEGTARLVPPGELEPLVAGIRDALAGRLAGARPCEAEARGLGQGDYVERYVRITRWLLGGPWDSRISAFAPLTGARTP